MVEGPTSHEGEPAGTGDPHGDGIEVTDVVRGDDKPARPRHVGLSLDPQAAPEAEEQPRLEFHDEVKRHIHRKDDNW